MLIAPLFDGSIDIIGDVHGELEPLQCLLQRLGYRTDGTHPDRRRLVFVGDLCDRGPDSPGVIALVRRFIDRGVAQCVLGNHELNILRRDLKHGNAWYLAPEHEEQRQEFRHSKAAPTDLGYHEFFLSLPLALERSDLRVVHAAWHPQAIDVLRASSTNVLELFCDLEARTEQSLRTEGIAHGAAEEKLQYGAALTDPSAVVPLLRYVGLLDEYRQTHNAVRVLTSGPERVTTRPFYANGKWRMCDRVLWWNEYTDDVPVVVGHYWRLADDDGEGDLSGGKPNLFEGAAPHEWVGAKRNVFCVDFSVGGRYRERAKGATAFSTRLAAVRWPEQLLVFDDGDTRALSRAH